MHSNRRLVVGWTSPSGGAKRSQKAELEYTGTRPTGGVPLPSWGSRPPPGGGSPIAGDVAHCGGALSGHFSGGAALAPLQVAHCGGAVWDVARCGRAFSCHFSGGVALACVVARSGDGKGAEKKRALSAIAFEQGKASFCVRAREASFRLRAREGERHSTCGSFEEASGSFEEASGSSEEAPRKLRGSFEEASRKLQGSFECRGRERGPSSECGVAARWDGCHTAWMRGPEGVGLEWR